MKYTNRLIDESSPYLLQHAHNPVNWYPWGEEALTKARREGKPILLSIGYFACHWCHVMAHESFEDGKIAAIMNEHFVNIKVDREERPDIDYIYQNVIQMFGVNGGWPLTVFLTPGLEPIYGGTYFPPEDRYGIPGFPGILLSISTLYKENRDAIKSSTKRIVEGLSRISGFKDTGQPIDASIIESAAQGLKGYFDTKNGGFGTKPKFPNTMLLAFFLRYYNHTKDEGVLNMVTLTLEKMAKGGIYDQLGGGFHRYSVDEKWFVPHFEKMLYDNALLLGLYIEAYQITKHDLLKDTIVETLEYVLKEMRDTGGGFYSAQDADSEGVEGKFFTWSKEEIYEILGDEKGEVICRYFGVREEGNFDGKNILYVSQEIEEIASDLEKSRGEVSRIISEGKEKLSFEREKRIRPGRDDKILTGWNALMISSLLEAYRTFKDKRYLKSAVDAVEFMKSAHYRNGRLLHTSRDGKAKLDAYLDDYAFFVQSLIDIYETTFDVEYLILAFRLNDTTVEQFYDYKDGGFFFTSKGHEPWIARPKIIADQSIPCGNSVACLNLLRLSYYSKNREYVKMVEKIFRMLKGHVMFSPSGFGSLLLALDFYLHPPVQIGILGRKDAADTKEMIGVIDSIYLPNKAVAVVDPEAKIGQLDLPFLEGKRPVDGRTTAYVCQGFSCSKPVTDAGELKKLLVEGESNQSTINKNTKTTKIYTPHEQ